MKNSLIKPPDYAAARFNELKANTANYSMSETELNMPGLEMLYSGQQISALEALKLNCFLYPNSSNVYDSYGEALALVNKKEEAVLMYRKSVALDPKNQDGINALKRLEKSEGLKAQGSKP